MFHARNPIERRTEPLAIETVELVADTRYTVRPERQIFTGRKTKLVYRAFYCGFAIGEIQPDTHRDAVVADVEEFRRSGGFGRRRTPPESE
jgi:hypothetical protein